MPCPVLVNDPLFGHDQINISTLTLRFLLMIVLRTQQQSRKEMYKHANAS